MTTPTEHRTRHRARVSLIGVAAALVAVVVAITSLVVAHDSTTDRATQQRPGNPPPSTVITPPAGAAGSGARLSVEARALALRPMTALPARAALPQPLARDSAGPPITLPDADAERDGGSYPVEYPATPEGALAQLQAWNEAAVTTGDPQAYAREYDVLAAPGAPPGRSSGLARLLTAFRRHAQLPPTGAVPDLAVTYDATHGQIKGTADDGQYVVACVLGQLSADFAGNVVSVGAGDCQALQRNGTRWRIAAGLRAAEAPSAWPGSRDAVRAGYRELM